MAIYHFSGQVLGRAAKQNPDGSWRPGSKVVAAAAYRAGERLSDHTHREEHDYSRRHGVVHSEILAPPGSAPWLTDRELLWNTVEAMEARRDAQLAREFNMALPYELDAAERLELTRDFVELHFVRRGMVADLALHNPNPEEGQNPKNFHAHVMLTLRRATPDGLDPVKTREWNSKEMLNLWRAEWALACNRALERAGKRTRVDHRSLQAQRDAAQEAGDRARAALLNRNPEIHVGPQARRQVQGGRTPASRDRYVGAERKREAERPPQRRRREYTLHDRGSRLDHLKNIISGNNATLKRDMTAIDRRFDRLSRKLDYWERRLNFKIEGAIKGSSFRFNRWKAAEAEKARQAEMQRRADHARKRLAQLRTLLKGLEAFVTLGRQRREAGLHRAREIERWVEAATRVRSRQKVRGRSRGQSRDRERM
ncbi:MobQ family relaxase [Rhizobium leguminosarum]|uniref:MobQ family relaxase n=1 Tax=Rhizobium leguminosarum TaxID=384 RepID=UPI003F95E87C